MNFQLVTLPIHVLAIAMERSAEEVKEKLQVFLKGSGLPSDSKQYVFAIKITQKGETNYLFVGYAVVPDDTAKGNDIEIVKVSNNQFLSFKHEGDLLSIFDENLSDLIEPYMKEHQLKLDISKLFGLVEETESGYNVYIPCKSK